MSATAEHVVKEGGDIPPHLAQAFREAADRALKLYNERREYQPYEGERLAPFNPLLERAEQLSGQVGSHQPYFNQAIGHANRGSESYLNNYREYTNPRQDAILRGIEEEGLRSFKEKALPALNAKYAALGHYGSTKHAKMAKRAALDVQKGISNMQEEALARSYNQGLKAFADDRARQLEAANLLSRLGVAKQSVNMAQVRALQEAGLLRQDREQMERDWQYELWKERMRHEPESLAQYFSVLQGNPIVPSMYRRSEIRQLRPSWHHQDWRDFGTSLLTDYVFNKGKG